MTGIEFILAIVPHMVDETPLHHHFTASMIPREAAEAFVQACEERDPFPLDADKRLCWTFLTVMAGLESGFNLHAQGDGGHALGPFQAHRGGAARDESWLMTTRIYLRHDVAEAITQCPEQPIARLAGERCGSSRHHAQRWAQITRLLHEVTWEP